MPGRFAHHAHGGHPFVWGLLFLIGVVALTAVVVYLIVRRPRTPAPPAVGPSGMRSFGLDPAVEAARIRYAQGQLTRDAYLQILGDLTGQHPLDTAPPPAATST